MLSGIRHHIVVASLAASSAVFVGMSHSAAADPACELPTGVLAPTDIPADATVFECDAVGRDVESEDGIRLSIPGPGRGIGTEIMTPTGSASFEIVVTPDGDVSFDEQGGADALPGTDFVDEEPADAQATNPTTGCDRTKYVKTGQKLPGNPTYNWWFGNGTLPSGITSSEGRTAISHAALKWFALKNPCNLAGPSNISVNFKGDTTWNPDMHVEGGQTKCNDNPDGKPTFDFGNLDDNGSPPVGLTCWWYDSDNVIDEWDTILNSTDYNWTINPGPNCSGKYDVTSVATHEMGHSWGLDDFYTSADKYLTMYGYSFQCKTLARTLGKGDVNGWKDVYNQ